MISSIRMIPLETRGLSVHHGTRGTSGNQKYFGIKIYKDAFVNGGLADGQTFGASYTEDSTPEDPIVHIRGNALSGSFDEIVHIHDIDPRNASYAELSALVGHLGKTGALDTNNGWLSGLPCDVPKGDIHQKKDYTKVLQDYMNGRGKYNRPMTIQAQTLLSAYQNQISQLDAMRGTAAQPDDDLESRSSVKDETSMDISSLRFNLGIHNFEKNPSQQAAFGPGEKIGIWKDYGDAPMSDQEIQEAINRGSATAPKDIFKVHEQFAAENKNFNLNRELSDKELETLKGKYNLNNMTPEDYRSLINDLCDMGVFKEEDKVTLTSPTMLTPIDWTGSRGLATIGKTRLASEDSFNPYDVYNPTDIFTWVKYRSSNEYFDSDKQNYFKTKDALLYERLGQVLNRLQ